MKCTKLRSLSLGWSLEFKTFSWAMIEPVFDPLDVLIWNRIEIGSLGPETSEEAVGILNGGFLPTVIRRTEEGPCSEFLVEQTVLGIFETVVVGERATEGLRERPQAPGKSASASGSVFVGNFGQTGIAGFAIHGNLKGATARTNDQVGFQVPQFLASISGERPLGQRGSVVDGRAGFAGESAGPSLGMRADQSPDQMTGLGIDPLVDGFMANDRLRGIVSFQVSGNDLGRPAVEEHPFDLRAKDPAFQTRANMILATLKRSFMSPVGIILVAPPISAALAGQGGMGTPQSLTNHSPGLATAA